MKLGLKCDVCGEEKLLSQFREKGGSGLLLSTCFDCRGISKRQRNARRLAEERRRSRATNFKKKNRGPALRAYIIALERDPCAYCGRRPGETIDHIVPIAAGGEGRVENLTGACDECNSAKRDETLLHFLLRQLWYNDTIHADPT